MIMNAYEEFQTIIMASSPTATAVRARQEAWQHIRRVKCVMLRSHEWVYSPDYLWFIHALHSLHSRWKGGVAYLRGKLAFPPSTTEEITTISTLYCGNPTNVGTSKALVSRWKSSLFASIRQCIDFRGIFSQRFWCERSISVGKMYRLINLSTSSPESIRLYFFKCACWQSA